MIGSETSPRGVAQPPPGAVAQPRRTVVIQVGSLVISLSWAWAWAWAWAWVLLIATLLVPALSAGGCSKGQRPGQPDGGRDGGEGPSPGACRGNTTCDSYDKEIVRSCDQGRIGHYLYTCEMGFTCSFGRCVSPSCAAAETRASVTGCLFYTAELDNVDSDDSKPSLIVVTNPGQSLATVQLEARVDGQGWAMVQSMSVDGGSAGSFTLDDRHIEGLGIGVMMARRVVSDAPVTVMLIQSADLDETSNSSAGTLVLPAHALGTRYMAMTYQQLSTTEIDDLAGGRGGAGELAIVATQDQTTISIWPPGMPMEAAPNVIVTLGNDGDVYQMVSEHNYDDLTGTTIVSDKPFALFSGNVTTTYGKAASGINSPDLAMEQMMPLGAWSKSYVAARLPAQSAACDSTLGGSSIGLWRFIASAQTVLHFSSSVPNPDLPDSMPVSRGLVYPLSIASDTDFVVRADVPFLAVQGMDCEPTLSSAVPGDASGGQQVFALPPNFDHMLAIVRKNDGNRGGPVVLDGEDITDLFIPAADGFEVARRWVPPCYGSVARCVHRLIGAHGLTLRGMDVVCGYALTFPTWVQCLADGCY